MIQFWSVFIYKTLVRHHEFSSVDQSCPTLCDPMDCSLPGSSVLQISRSLLKLTSIVSHANQPSRTLSSPSPPAFNLSQHQGLFPWVSSFHQVAKVMELQLQHQFFQWIFRITDWFDILSVQRTLKSLLQHRSPKALILQLSAFFMVQPSHLYMTTGKTIGFTYGPLLAK